MSNSIPFISSIFPFSNLSIGTPITITGGNFVTGQTTIILTATPGPGNASTVGTVVNPSTVNFTLPQLSVGGNWLVQIETPFGFSQALEISVTTGGGGGGTPVISSILPSFNVPNTGNIPMSINGSNFVLGNTTIFFTSATGPSTASTTANVVSGGTQALFTLPHLGADGLWLVQVETPFGISQVATITVVNPPIVTNISPTSGPTSGGTQVTVIGSGLNNVTEVFFGLPYGNVQATGVNIISANELIVTTPAVTQAATVLLTVNNAAGSSPPSPGSQFTYLSVPVILSINPTFGDASGGTSVYISGNNFGNLTNVLFNNIPVETVSSLTQNFIIAVTPQSANVGNNYTTGFVQVVIVTNSGQNSIVSPQPFCYTPFVNEIVPDGANAGQQIAIRGGGFTRVTQVELNATQISQTIPIPQFQIVNDQEILFTVPVAPPGVTAAYVVVACSEGFFSSIEPVNLLTYGNVAPTVTSVQPLGGSVQGGYPVTILGTGFIGITSVMIGPVVATFTIVSPTQITATIPHILGSTQVGPVSVQVINPTGTGSGSFTYLPEVLSISPPVGTAGTQTVISGYGFSHVTTVNFGQASAQFSIVSDGQINATAPSVAEPANVPQPISVLVGQYGSVTTSNPTFTFEGAPVITSISPPIGPFGTGETVTITGVGFTGVTSLVYNGVTAPPGSISLISDTQINAVIPFPGYAAWGYVLLTNPHGTSSQTASSVFTFVPTITSAIPPGIPVGGNVVVTLDGSGFQFANVVEVSGIVVPGNISVTNDNQLTFVAPPSPSGQAGVAYVNVCISAFQGIEACSVTGFSINYGNALPTVSQVSPISGPVTGGTSVTITGTNFAGVAGVTFGNVAATSFNVLGPTQITVVSPNFNNLVTGVDIQVLAFAGVSALNPSDVFHYVPVITAIIPNTGTLSGGNQVTIQGNGLGSISSVNFGGTVAAPFTVIGPTSIQGIVPPSPNGQSGTVPVLVSAVEQGQTFYSIPSQAATYTYSNPLPIVQNVSPNNGPLTGGTQVFVFGANFSGVNGAFFAGQPLPFRQIDANNISVTMPAVGTALIGDITVQTTAGDSANNPNDLFVYTPVITQITPSSGPVAGGNQITIFGQGFANATDIYFNGNTLTQDQFTIIDPMTIIVTVPPADVAGPAIIRVGVSFGGNIYYGPITNNYIYGSPFAIITSLTPNFGPMNGGTSVAVTGNNFLNVQSVLINGVHAVFSNVGPQTMTLTMPGIGLAGQFEVQVVTPAGTSTPNPPSDTFVYTPIVTQVIPNTGGATVPALVTIDGAGLSHITNILVGGNPTAPPTVVNDGQISCTLPGLNAGTYDVQAAITIDNTVYLSPPSTGDRFTYGNITPTITGVSPVAGPVNGGTPVTITGTNFNNITSLNFGGIPATGYSSPNPQTLFVIAPAGSIGRADVVVTTLAGSSPVNPLTDSWTWVPIVTSVAPTFGDVGGGTIVQVNGIGFTNASSVDFSGPRFTATTGNFQVLSDNEIVVTTPEYPGGSGPTDVLVGVFSGTVFSLPNPPGDVYNYGIPLPTVTDLSLHSGSVVGGYIITVTGTNFLGTTSVFMGGGNVPFQVTDSGHINVTVPGALAVSFTDVLVTNAAGSSIPNPPATRFIWVPEIDSINPNTGPVVGETVVTILGHGFTGVIALNFGGVPSPSFQVLNDAQIAAVTPPSPLPSPGTGQVAVQTESGLIIGTITSLPSPAATFTYIPAVTNNPPTITSIVPAISPENGGATLQITGTGFLGFTSATIGGIPVAQAIVNSATSMTIVTSAQSHIGQYELQIDNTFGASTPNPPVDIITFVPVVTSVIPNSGPLSGFTITNIGGEGFQTVFDVTFGGIRAPSFTVLNDTQIIATTPTGVAPGPVDTQVYVQFGTTPPVTLSGGVQHHVVDLEIPGEGLIHAQATYTVPPPPSDAPIGLNNPDLFLWFGITDNVKLLQPILTWNYLVAQWALVSSIVSGSTILQQTNSISVQPGTVLTATIDRVGSSGSTTYTAQFTGYPSTALTTTFATQAEVIQVDFETHYVTDCGGFPNTQSTIYSNIEIQTDSGFPPIQYSTALYSPTACGDSVSITGANPSISITFNYGNTGTQSGSDIFSSEPTPADLFTYNPNPTLNSISPDEDSIIGGSLITINGTGFLMSPNIAVLFGQYQATNVQVLNDTTLTCIDPFGVPGLTQVNVFIGDLTTETYPFTYIVPVGGPSGPLLPCNVSRIYDRATFAPVTGDGGPPDVALSLCDRVPAGEYIIIHGLPSDLASVATQATAWNMRGVVITLGDDREPSDIQQQSVAQHQLGQIEFRPSTTNTAAYWQFNQFFLDVNQIAIPLSAGQTAGVLPFRSQGLVVGGHFYLTQPSFDAPVSAGAAIAGIRNLLNLDFVLIDIDNEAWTGPDAGHKLLSLLQVYHQRTFRSPQPPDLAIISQHYPAFVVLPATTDGMENLLASDGCLEGLVNGYSGPKTIASPRISSSAQPGDLVAAWQWARPALNDGTGMNHCEFVVELGQGGQFQLPSQLQVNFPGISTQWTVNSGVIFYDDYAAAQRDNSGFAAAAPTAYWNYGYPATTGGVQGAIVPVIYPDPPPLAQTGRDWALLDANGNRQYLTIGFENWRTGHVTNPNWPTWFTMYDPQCPMGATQPTLGSWIRVNGNAVPAQGSSGPTGVQSSGPIQGHTLVLSGVPVSGDDGMYPLLFSVQRSQSNTDLFTPITAVLQVVDPSRVNHVSPLMSSTGVPLDRPDIAASQTMSSGLHGSVPRQVSTDRIPLDWGPATNWCVGTAALPAGMQPIPQPPRVHATPFQSGGACGFTYDPALINQALSDCTGLPICTGQNSPSNYAGFVFATAASLSGYNPNFTTTVPNGLYGLFALSTSTGIARGYTFKDPSDPSHDLSNPSVQLAVAEPLLQSVWQQTISTDCINNPVNEQVTHAYMLFASQSGSYPDSAPAPLPPCSQTAAIVDPPGLVSVGGIAGCFLGTSQRYNSPSAPPSSGLGRYLSICQMLQLAAQAGFPDTGSYGVGGATALVTIVAIALHEGAGTISGGPINSIDQQAVGVFFPCGNLNIECGVIPPPPDSTSCIAYGALQLVRAAHPCMTPDCEWTASCSLNYLVNKLGCLPPSMCNFLPEFDGDFNDSSIIVPNIALVQAAKATCDLRTPITGGSPPTNTNVQPPPSGQPAPPGSTLYIGNATMGCPINYADNPNAILSGSCYWHFYQSGENLLAVDVAAQTGIPILATCSGTITYRGWDPAHAPAEPDTGYGVMVIIQCDPNDNLKPDPVYTRLAHMPTSCLPCDQGGNCGLPQSGVYVALGTQIGVIDSTGNITGPHTHYEINVGGLGSDYTICPSGDAVPNMPNGPFGPRGGATPSLMGYCVQDGPYTDRV